jgi:Spy/CpxP family protein refolding chaperone
MTKAKVLLVLAFIVVCAAGAVVGTAVDRRVRPPEPPMGVWDRLHLTPEQRDQMKQAWDPVSQLRGSSFHKRHQFDQDRFNKIEALLSPDQKSEFKQIQDEFEKENRDLETQMHDAVAKAEAKMRSILTPAQLAELDEARRKMPHDHDHGPGTGPPGMGGPGMGPPGMGPPGHHHDHERDHHRSSTRPATQPDAGAV